MSRLNKEDKAIIVPLEVWFGNSVDLLFHEKQTDLGAFAESLILYDRVVLNASQPYHLRDLLEWFRDTDSPDALMTLVEDGAVTFYYYNFRVNPIYDPRVDAFHIVNINEDAKARFFCFERDVLGPDLFGYFPTAKKHQRFLRLMREEAIIVEADAFGKAADDSRKYITEPEVYQDLMNHMLNSLRRAGYTISHPEVRAQATVSREMTPNVTANVNFDGIAGQLPHPLKFGKHTPVGIATYINRLLWSAAQMSVDLYLTEPTMPFLMNQIEAAIKHFGAIKEAHWHLVTAEGLPDFRMAVNNRALSCAQVLRMREAAADFRVWLHEAADLGPEELRNRYDQLIEKSGLSSVQRRVLDEVFVALISVGGTVAGQAIGGTAGAVMGAVGAAATKPFLRDVFEELTGGWCPKVIGNRIKRIAAS